MTEEERMPKGRPDPQPSGGEGGNSRIAELENALLHARADLERARTHDAVTGALTHFGITRVFEALSHGGDGGMMALVLDCDDFGRINERFGHVTGNLVLRRVAARIQDALRPGDLLGRVAGDRFLVFLLCSDLSEARGVAERVRAGLASEPFVWEPEPVHLTASIGLVPVPGGPTSIEEVLSLGRVAVEKSKSRGKNRVSLAEDTAGATPWLTPALRAFIGALRSGRDLSIHVQDIHALPGEGVCGGELLVRGPTGPLQRPVDLFRVAEEHRLTTALDMTCLRLAVRSAIASGRAGTFHVNVLPTTLLEVPAEQLVDLLGTPPPGARWCLELSERQFFGEPAELLAAMRPLRDVGVCIGIDDVGSCRGGLDNVLTLEPSIVKVDMGLVRGIAQDPWHQRIVGRLVRIADALQVEVVAEGVENREDLSVILDLGVRAAQGYLWGRPALLEPAGG